MVGGFTFDGVDIADLGLEYAPELNNTYVYKPAQFKPHEQLFDGHDGGYYYGSTVQPKEFTLRCIYEAQPVLDGIMSKIFHVFKRNRTGKLVFKKRPWCWYAATVTNVSVDQMLNFENGVVTISMKAYYPFARSDYMTIPAEYENDLMSNSAMMPAGWTHETSFATSQNPITTNTTLLLYNPGTETAKVAVRIAGDVGTGVSVANATTGQNMRFVAITPNSCPGSYYIQTDGLSGQTTFTNGTVSQPGFLYHDYGFIDLAPGFPAYRNITVDVTDNRNVNSDGLFAYDMLGRHIYFANGTVAKVVNVHDSSWIEVDTTVSSAENGVAQILQMNEIVVSALPAGGSFSLTKLEFVYKPTFA